MTLADYHPLTNPHIDVLTDAGNNYYYPTHLTPISEPLGNRSGRVCVSVFVYVYWLIYVFLYTYIHKVVFEWNWCQWSTSSYKSNDEQVNKINA